jgi:hypothetical protein
MKGLEKKAKEVILEQIGELEEVTKENVVELIRNHYFFNIESLKEQELGRAANRLIAKHKDDNGIRSFFNCKNDDGSSNYVNVDKTKDLKALENIDRQLTNKYKGLNESRKKINRRQKEISGQISFGNVENS